MYLIWFSLFLTPSAFLSSCSCQFCFFWCFSFHSHSVTMEGLSPVMYFSFVHLYMCIIMDDLQDSGQRLKSLTLLNIHTYNQMWNDLLDSGQCHKFCDIVKCTCNQIWNDLRDWLVSAIRDTVERMQDQIFSRLPLVWGSLRLTPIYNVNIYNVIINTVDLRIIGQNGHSSRMIHTVGSV